jgi:uncharacterized membrane protein
MSFRDDPIPTRAPAWRWPLAYVLTLVVFLAMDAVWLSLSSSALYQPAIGHLMAATVDWRAVAVFYPLYVGGLVFFAIAPALASRPFAGALGRGALFGFLAYATYDFTNQATLRDWPWAITVADLVWGSFVSGVSAWAAARLTSRRANPARAR